MQYLWQSYTKKHPLFMWNSSLTECPVFYLATLVAGILDLMETAEKFSHQPCKVLWRISRKTELPILPLWSIWPCDLCKLTRKLTPLVHQSSALGSGALGVWGERITVECRDHRGLHGRGDPSSRLCRSLAPWVEEKVRTLKAVGNGLSRLQGGD